MEVNLCLRQCRFWGTISNCSTTNCQFLKLGSFCPEVKTTFANRKVILAIAAVTAIKLRLGRNQNKAKRLEKEKNRNDFWLHVSSLISVWPYPVCQLKRHSSLTQMCQMVFQVQGKTENYVRLKIDEPGISFKGKLFMFDMFHYTFMQT